MLPGQSYVTIPPKRPFPPRQAGTPLPFPPLSEEGFGPQTGMVPGLQRPAMVAWGGVGEWQSFPRKSRDLALGSSEVLVQFWQPELFLLQSEIREHSSFQGERLTCKMGAS